MNTTLVVHVIAGSVGLVAGFVAIFAAKGARLHRRSGLVFVCAIVAMGLSGAAIAALTSTEISVIAGMTTAYLAVTGFNTVRRPTPAGRRVDAGAMVTGMILGVTSLALGVHTLVVSPDGMRDGLPAFPFFVMGVPALVGSAGDARLRRAGGIAGARRLARHLWRMCYALFIASMSFFLGQADKIPEALRNTAVLTLLAFLPALVMLYWLWRVRFRRGLERTDGATRSGPAEPSPAAATAEPFSAAATTEAFSEAAPAPFSEAAPAPAQHV